MTGRKDTVKRERIAELLRKGCTAESIMLRIGCNKDLVYQVCKEMKGTTK